jgi:hypothetical protein
MRWFRKVPAVATDPLDDAQVRLDEARNRRRDALKNLVTKLCDIPIEDGLSRLGDDLSSTDRKAK